MVNIFDGLDNDYNLSEEAPLGVVSDYVASAANLQIGITPQYYTTL